MDIYNKKPLRITNDGIKIFSEKDFYWGILDRREMADFIQLSQKEGYKNAIKKTEFSNRKFNSYAGNYDRADFRFLLPLRKDATVLDVGSGYGNITIPLARDHKKIIAVDASLELLQFSKQRAQSEGLNNIDYLKIDPLEFCNLPFAPKTFDLIVVSGVLEWIGPAKLDEKPNRLQQKFLNYLNTLLKDDGVLYLAIENRMFLGWLSRDPHSKLKYTSILPRPIANLYAKYKGHKDGYRTYIYSKLGYFRMLRKAGFKSIVFYYPFPSYRQPNTICPDSRVVYRFLFTKNYAREIFTRKWFLLFKVLNKLGVFSFFVSSFMIVSSKKQTGKVARDTEIPVLLKVLSDNNEKIKPSACLMKIQKSNNEHAHFFVFRNTSIPYAEVRVPRNTPLDYKNIAINYL